MWLLSMLQHFTSKESGEGIYTMGSSAQHGTRKAMGLRVNKSSLTDA